MVFDIEKCLTYRVAVDCDSFMIRPSVDNYFGFIQGVLFSMDSNAKWYPWEVTGPLFEPRFCQVVGMPRNVRYKKYARDKMFHEESCVRSIAQDIELYLEVMADELNSMDYFSARNNTGIYGFSDDSILNVVAKRPSIYFDGIADSYVFQSFLYGGVVGVEQLGMQPNKVIKSWHDTLRKKSKQLCGNEYTIYHMMSLDELFGVLKRETSQM